MSFQDAPASARWVDILHWCVRIMDADDADLGFIASLLSYAVKHEGLTEKQARYANKTIDRLTAQRDRTSTLSTGPVMGTKH